MIFVSKEDEESGEEEYEEQEQEALLLKSLEMLFVFLPPAFAFIAFAFKDDDVDEPSE
jgi:hypothetical protein